MRKAIYLVFILVQFHYCFSQQRSELDSLLLVVKELPDSSKADIFLDIALAYRTLEVGKAYQYAQLSLELASDQEQLEIQAEGRNILGSIYTVLGDFKKANNQLHQALKLYELLGRKRGVANTSNSLGVLYFNQKDYENALKYYQKGYSLIDTTTQDGAFGTFNLNIGEVYQVLGDYTRAKPLLMKALNVFVDIGDDEGKAYCYGILARIAFNEHNFLRAIEYCNMALEHFAVDRNDLGRVEYYILLSDIYTFQNMYQTAEVDALRALEIASSLNALQWMMRSHQQLAKVYKVKNIFDKAYFHVETAAELRSKLLDEKGQQQINNMRIIYETDQLLQENKLLKINSQLSEKTIDEQRSVTIVVASFLLVISILAFFILRANKIKQKSNRLLRLQNEEIRQQREEILTQAEGLKDINEEIIHKNELIEKKNKDITDSINYAKRIQAALLPYKSRIDKGLLENFLLYKPKDIVSGDFYWYGEFDDKVVIAVADCTGHGIPGAFMSFIGHDMLNYICNIQRITAPSEILKEMKRSVIRLLRQEETGNRDGFDLSICVWDKKKNKLTFAGANHSLIYIQNEVLHHVKGNRTTIGLDERGNYEAFDEHSITVTSDTAFYLYTDGFVDQFGGPDDKKFMVAPFKELLLKNHLKQMNTQGQILHDTLAGWMGSKEQVDDILVFGFRLFD
ncbi:MAG: serine phosphatase RsbU (regulator of sigma subunit) [Marivirga sp.]|jgi:serine phosphatase RsbU (regulator of sigma subunit)